VCQQPVLRRPREEQGVLGRVAHEDAVVPLHRLLPRVRHARSHPVALIRVRKGDRRVPERRHAGRRRRRPGALPGIRTDVVVIAARTEEGRLRPELRHQAEPEQIAVERHRVVDVRHTQVGVSDDRAAGQPVEGLGGRVVELAEEIIGVERQGGQEIGDEALPLLARPVGVDLDPVVVGILEVDGLADPVVGETGERYTVAGSVGEPAREARPLGHEKRDVEEPGVAGARPRARLLDEAHELGIAPERGPTLLAPEDAEADLVLPVVERPVEIGDRQLDGAHPRLRRDLHAAKITHDAGHAGSATLAVVRIRWYGQSAFLLTSRDGARVFIDPFGEIPEEMLALRRDRMPDFRFDYAPITDATAELLLVTHEHFDHNAVEVVGGDPHLIRSTAGTFESPLGEIVVVASEHDEAAGTQRGPNTIVVFSLDDLRIAHFGDFGQGALRPEQRDAIGPVDVLFLPVGDGPTIGGERAAAVVRSLQPRLVVCMHHGNEAVSFLGPPEPFLDALQPPRVERLDTSEADVEPLLGEPSAPTVVIFAPPLA
jgi:L-ascorbate metabolism protein UlaG (beta-lactamase superfamily)